MNHPKRTWLHDLLLIVVLAAATWFRVVGMNWDADQHLHPDERFLTMVETALQVRRCALPDIPLELCPADEVSWLGLGEYLDIDTSPLNPRTASSSSTTRMLGDSADIGGIPLNLLNPSFYIAILLIIFTRAKV